MTIGIYGILNKLDYKIYIGKAKNIEKRFRTHKNYLNKDNHCNNILELLEQNPNYIYNCIYTACNKNKSYKGYLWKSVSKELTEEICDIS